MNQDLCGFPQARSRVGSAVEKPAAEATKEETQGRTAGASSVATVKLGRSGFVLFLHRSDKSEEEPVQPRGGFPVQEGQDAQEPLCFSAGRTQTQTLSRR